jgi:hypothetical protein
MTTFAETAPATVYSPAFNGTTVEGQNPLAPEYITELLMASPAEFRQLLEISSPYPEIPHGDISASAPDWTSHSASELFADAPESTASTNNLPYMRDTLFDGEPPFSGSATPRFHKLARVHNVARHASPLSPSDTAELFAPVVEPADLPKTTRTPAVVTIAEHAESEGRGKRTTFTERRARIAAGVGLVAGLGLSCYLMGRGASGLLEQGPDTRVGIADAVTGGLRSFEFFTGVSALIGTTATARLVKYARNASREQHDLFEYAPLAFAGSDEVRTRVKHRLLRKDKVTESTSLAGMFREVDDQEPYLSPLDLKVKGAMQVIDQFKPSWL